MKKGRTVKRASLISVVAMAGLSAVALAGCASGDTGGGDAATRACVILPDAASSPRWESLDRKYLEEGLEAAGFEEVALTTAAQESKVVDGVEQLFPLFLATGRRPR